MRSYSYFSILPLFLCLRRDLSRHHGLVLLKRFRLKNYKAPLTLYDQFQMWFDIVYTGYRCVRLRLLPLPRHDIRHTCLRKLTSGDSSRTYLLVILFVNRLTFFLMTLAIRLKPNSNNYRPSQPAQENSRFL